MKAVGITEVDVLVLRTESDADRHVTDILRARGQFTAEWFLVILRLDAGVNWALKPINYALNFYGNGPVRITAQGNLRIGRIAMQREGGDGVRRTAAMLQFKLNPALVVAA